jgi:hypothetical protein
MTSADLAQARALLARALQLNERFQVAFVSGAPAQTRELAATAVADAARATQRVFNLHWFLPDISTLDAPSDVASVWVVDLGEEENIGPALTRLNRTRDTMGQHANTTLLVLLRQADAGEPARVAPDLWSIRSFSTSLQEGAASDDGALSQWVRDCDAAFEDKLAQRPHHRTAYQHGTYRFAYRVWRAIPQPSSQALRSFMHGVPGYTGWRPWWVPVNANPPYSAGPNLLECWMVHDDRPDADPAHSDFWRASHQGEFYLVRGYDEDGVPNIKPGTEFSLNLPIWRLGEALLHAQYVSREMGIGTPQVEFTATWSGLAGRSATNWPDGLHRRVEERSSSRDEVTQSMVIDTDALDQDEEFVAIVKRFLRPLHDAFLQDVEDAFVLRHLGELRNRPVRA